MDETGEGGTSAVSEGSAWESGESAGGITGGGAEKAVWQSDTCGEDKEAVDSS